MEGGESKKFLELKRRSGCYRNKLLWIVNAIDRALGLFIDGPLDVYLVYYGDGWVNNQLFLSLEEKYRGDSGGV
jgi:hypothetical protein